MSYISNLVQRTLGVTPVAQPVIQAKFAPQGRSVGVAVQDGGVGPIANLREGQTPVRPQSLREQPNPEVPHTSPATPAQTPVANSKSRNFPRTDVHGEVPDGPRFVEHGSVPSTTGPPHESRISAAPVRSMNESPVRATVELNLAHGANPASDEFRLMSAESFAPARTRFSLSPAALSRSSELESAEAPIVRVHIGRVDVRMVAQGTKESRATLPSGTGAKPVSLEEYLKARQRGQR